MKRRIDGKMRNRYSTPSDIYDRLDRCYFMYKDKPCLVMANDERLQVWDVMGRRPINEDISYDDPDLDISSIELGYVEGSPLTGGRVTYLSRWPEKRYKQGVCSNNIKIVGIDGAAGGHYPVLGSKPFEMMLADDYGGSKVIKQLPTLAAGEYVVSKDVALKKSSVGVVFVYYKTEEIGWIPPHEVSLSVVKNGYKWVIERMLRPLGIDMVDR